jgi:hypothetical protein
MRIIGFRRQVHGKIDRRGAAAGQLGRGFGRLAARLGRCGDERAAADRGGDQTALLGFDIAAGDRGEIHIDAGRQAALRWQTVAGGELAGFDITGDGVRDGKISRFVGSGEIRRPSIHLICRCEVSRDIDRIRGRCQLTGHCRIWVSEPCQAPPAADLTLGGKFAKG